MQKPNEAFKNTGKRNELEIFAVKTITPRENGFACIFSSQPKPEVQYEVFPVPPREHGIFYIDDLYVIVKTDLDTKKRDLHFWFGRGYKENPPPWVYNFATLELDWTANQHFEFQGHECELFESYFDKIQPVIRYKQGAHPNPAAERVRGLSRFYKLERLSEGNYRVREIPFDIALMTKEECFILDNDYNTRSYVSDRTPEYEKDKSVIIANHIRDLEHDSNGDVEVVDLTTFKNEADKEAYIRASNMKEDDTPPRVIDYEQPDEDPKLAQLSAVDFIFSDDVDLGYPPRFRYIPKPKMSIIPEKKNLSLCARLKKNARKVLGQEEEKEKEIYLPCVEERFIKTTVSQPLKQEMLDSKKCYILEGSQGVGIFMWVGKACDAALIDQLTECLRNELRKEDHKQQDHVNKEYLHELGADVYEKKKEEGNKENEEEFIPRWTHFYKVIDGNEPLKFKRYFQNWE